MIPTTWTRATACANPGLDDSPRRLTARHIAPGRNRGGRAARATDRRARVTAPAGLARCPMDKVANGRGSAAGFTRRRGEWRQVSAPRSRCVSHTGSGGMNGGEAWWGEIATWSQPPPASLRVVRACLPGTRRAGSAPRRPAAADPDARWRSLAVSRSRSHRPRPARRPRHQG